MQVLPETGRELGVGNIHEPDPNVHAGAKYMAQLMDNYFNDASFDEQNRNLLRSPPTTQGQAKFNRCGARRRRKSSTQTCGSTMSSGWLQRG
jgi:hypothetical protein